MASLKSLSFTVAPKISAADPVVQRRNKLIARLQQQVMLANDPSYKIPRQKWVPDENGVKQLRDMPKKVRQWWRTDTTGSVVLQVLYGARPIEFEKGKAAIAVGPKEKLVPIIETIIAAVQAGELDAVIGAMSKTAVQVKSKKAA